MKFLPKNIVPVKEAFRSGYAKTAIDKMSRILGKRIRAKYVGVSDLSFEDNNFSAYRMAFGSNWTVDVLFGLGKSDKILSINCFNRISNKPDATINVEDLNIVQLVNLIGDILTDNLDPMDFKEADAHLDFEFFKLKEAGRPNVSMETVNKWVESDRDNIDLLRDERLSHVYRDYFEPWLSHNGRSLSNIAFGQAAREILKTHGFTNRFFRKDIVVDGQPIKLTQTTEPKKQADDFNNLVNNLEYEERYEMVKEYIHLIATNALNSLYIYGPPGTGKSYTVYEALKAERIAYKTFSGGVKGVEELVRVLYTYRDNTVLVFDDFDSSMKNKEQVNIMKAALQPDPSRTITYVNNRPGPKKTAVPPQFEFTSSIIVITNQTKIDPAIRSRSMTVNIILTKEQMMDRISKNLKEFLPDVDMNIKLEVFEFLQDNKSKIRHLDFRQFQFAVVNRLARPTDDTWKKWALVTLNS